jgi:quaternary ammonium compound-resistance protein SugE
VPLAVLSTSSAAPIQGLEGFYLIANFRGAISGQAGTARHFPKLMTRTASSHFQSVWLGECDMAWLILTVAAVIEVIWAWSLKASEGFTRWPIIIVMLLTMMSTTWLLSLATRTLPLGTAYTVWTGAGIVGSVAVGIFLFGEEASAMRLGAIALIICGVVMLRLSEG